MADSQKLEILITAKDEASKILSGLGKVAGGVLKVGLGAAVAGIGALGVGLGISMKEAMDAQDIQSQLAAVLKSTGGVAGVTSQQVNDLANAYQSQTRYADDVIIGGENILLTFTKIGKGVFPMATQTMLDMSQALGTDLQGSAIQLGKALQDPIAGISALSRVGVNFSDSQKKVIEQLMKAGKLEEAQKIILNELQTEFGGSAVAAGTTFAGQLDILKNSLLNVAEGVGTAVIPVLGQLMTNVIMPMLPAIVQFGTDAAAWLGVNLPIAIQFLTNAWTTVLYPAIQVVWAWMSSVLIPFLVNQVIPWLQVNIPIALQFLSDVWTNVLLPAIIVVWNWLSTVLIPFFQSVILPWLQVAIPAALKFLSDFWQAHGAAILAAASNAWNTIKTIVSTIIGILGPIISGFLDAVKSFWAEHGAAIMAKAKEIWDAVMERFNWFKDEFTKIFDAFKLAFQGDWYGFGAKLREVWDDTWEKIKQVGTDTWNAIKKFFSETDWGTVGTNILKGVAAGITAGLQIIKDAAVAAAKAAFEAAKGFLGIKSPSTVFMGVGQNMMAGMALGISNNAGMPALATARAAAGSVSSINNNFYLNANYSNYQSPTSLAADARMLQQMYGSGRH